MDDGFPDLLKVVPLLFLVLGAGNVVRVLVRMRRERQFTREALAAGGEVADVIEYRRQPFSPDHGHRQIVIEYAPVLRFTLPDGREVQAESYDRSSTAPGIGSRVAVRYDREAPDRCRIDGGGASRWGRHGTELVGSALLLVFGWVVLAFLSAFE